MAYVGTKVVRGPNWRWGLQDGGEGTEGTVYAFGKGIPEKTVLVKWEKGISTNYSIGYLNQYDLSIIDNAQTGVIHEKISCNGCNVKSILGMRYHCKTCNSCNLCAACYHGDKHSLSHTFILFETDKSSGLDLPERTNARCVLKQNSKYYTEHLPLLGKPDNGISNNIVLADSFFTDPKECAVCSEVKERNVRFEPCNHSIICEDCCPRVKICTSCKVPVKKRITEDGRVILSDSQSRIQKLEAQISQIEEKYFCGICTDKPCNVLFMCGHRSCSGCDNQLTTCHMCRKKIVNKIRI